LLNTAGLDDAAYVERLQLLPAGTETAAETAAANWAQASCAVATQPGLYPSRARIDPQYVQRWRPRAEAQLRRGGAHLATVLNRALAR
jgi:hypothetical protein